MGEETPTRWIFPVANFLYMMSMIVLVNLLVAAMTDTYQRVRVDSRLFWLFERAQLIQEFKRKGALPPPLNIVSLLLYDVPNFWRYARKRCGFA